MKSGVLSASAVIIVLVLCFFSWESTLGEYAVEYRIQLQGDCTAAWVIKQAGLDALVSPETFVEFQAKVNSLVALAQNETGRSMTAERFRITADVAGYYTMVTYSFDWQNFSESVQAKIVVSDVFRAGNLFEGLFGDGKVCVSYPVDYVVESVSPAPYLRNDSLQTLEWLGTMDFVMGEPRIVLKASTSGGPAAFLGENLHFIVGLAVVAAGFSTFFMFKRKRNARQKADGLEGLSTIKDDEDRIIDLLRASDGSAFQSSIVEALGFSKAKTSQLLASLEKKGRVKRYKKGREKIVILNRQFKSELQ